MGARLVILAFVVAAIPWGIGTRWQMHLARSARERAWVGRMSVGIWFGSLLAPLALVFLTTRGPGLALPSLAVAAFAAAAVRRGLRRARARIRVEEASDAFSRAKRVN